MLVIVCYDVNTETREGRRRLRRVARTCEGTGQRVQKSVFECKVNLMQFESLERDLLAIIDPATDCLRLYRLPETRGAEVREQRAFPRHGLRCPDCAVTTAQASKSRTPFERRAAVGSRRLYLTESQSNFVAGMFPQQLVANPTQRFARQHQNVSIVQANRIAASPASPDAGVD